METFLIALASMVVVLGILILVHELGHYGAAKLFGVRVEVFSIGFGKRLFGFRKGDTDYRVSALPLGGYVKMAGENPLESSTGAPDEFMSHPRWQRFVIALAGPAMNILLAVGLLTAVLMNHFEHPKYLDEPAVVGGVEKNSPADKAGIRAGDRIVRIDSWQNPTWDDVQMKAGIEKKVPLDVAVQRGNSILETPIQPIPYTSDPDHRTPKGLYPYDLVILMSIDPSMPAAKAGLRLGDELVAVDGNPVHSIFTVRSYLQEGAGKPVQLTALRDGKEVTVPATPVFDKSQKAYRLGFGSDQMTVGKLSFSRALQESIKQNKKNSLLIVDLVGQMLRNEVSITQMEGPIGIAKMSGQGAQIPGWVPKAYFLSLISLNLGIFNLLPIPILDGGMILMLIIEGIARRNISLRVKERIYQTAFVFLVLFAAVVIYNDIVKLMPSLPHKLP